MLDWNISGGGGLPWLSMNVFGVLGSAGRLVQAGVSGAAQALGTGGRRRWVGSGRMWVEVRGISGVAGAHLAALTLEAVRAMPGVRWAECNRTLSRVVLAVEDSGPSVDEVIAVLEQAEIAAPAERSNISGSGPISQAPALPGDAAAAAGRMVALAVDVVGVTAALSGRMLRLPRLPGAVAATVTLVDTQPRLRRAVESRLGKETADVVLAVSLAAAQTLSQGPASLLVDVALRASLLAEARAGQRAWSVHEPALAARASCDEPFPDAPRPVPRPAGPIEKYADAAAAAGLLGAGVLGAVTGRLSMAADAVLVAAPKATRTAPESFAATLSRALSDDNDVLVLHGEALRRLDRVDALLVDPRVLLGDELTVREVDGIDGPLRSRVWAAAREDARGGLLPAGWHSVRALSPAHDLPDLPAGRVAVTAVPDPLAAAVLAAARQARIDVLSLDVQELGELRAAFDELHDVGGSTDAALSRAVTALQTAGKTVAVLAVHAPAALAAADLALAVRRNDVDPAWTADLLLPDLAAAWRIVQAVPAARMVSRRAVELSAGGTLLGALLMLPGVRGRGPGPVVGAAAAGWWTGRAAALRIAGMELPAAVPIADWHNLPVEQVLAMLPHQSGPVAESREVQLGTSGWLLQLPGQLWHVVVAVPGRAAESLVGAVREELSDPLTPILATGAAASAVLGSPVDAVLVGSVVLGNAILSAAQRLRAERLLARLLARQQTPARLIVADLTQRRRYAEVSADQLRAGQLIEVRPGEIVPSDARIVDAAGVEVDESSLTGESLPVAKQAVQTPGAPLAERSCMVYEGTVVLSGTVTAVVTAVGAATEAGRADAFCTAGGLEVGLQAQLGRLTSKVLPVTAAGGAAVTLLGLLRGAGARQAVTSGVSIAVAAVPEGLPLVATLAQQAAARRLSTLGILVRSPRSIEALGRVDVICFDKTGTLTQNVLQVRQVLPAAVYSRDDVLAAAAVACPRPRTAQGLSSATDTAVLAACGGDTPPRDAELPFRAGRPFSAGLSGRWMNVKGAPELMLAAAGAAPDVTAQVEQLARQGLRVLAVARRRLTPAQAAAAVADEQSMVEFCGGRLQLLGFLGIADTVRPDAVGLLDVLTDQGLGVRVITGDHPLTAMAIVADLGHTVTADRVLTGPEWAELSRKGQRRAVERAVIFARMSPEQKVHVVQALEDAGHVCAMIGDGANDAAAIRAASIGIGVASHGSDPARGAADVVLTGGNVGDLVAALSEGSGLWQRVQSAVSVLLGGNAGEVAFTIVGTAITGRARLNARQLLLVNMFTDALPAAAVAVSPPSNGAGQAQGQGHTKPDVRGLDPDALWRSVAVRGAATTLGATTAWTMATLTGLPRRASTVGLVALVSTQLGQTLLDSRSPLVIATAAGSLVGLGALISTPGISQLLGCTPLGPLGWAQALGSASAATAAAAVAPGLLHRWTHPDDAEAAPLAKEPSLEPRSLGRSAAAIHTAPAPAQ